MSLREARESLEFALEARAWRVGREPVHGARANEPLHNQIFGYAEQVATWGPHVLVEHILPEDRDKFEKGFARRWRPECSTCCARALARRQRPLDSRPRARHLRRAGTPAAHGGRHPRRHARKDVDALLLASEERQRLLLDSAADYAIFSTDAGGHIRSWNSGAERIIGYTSDEVVGSHVEIIFTPEDRERDADKQG